MTTTDFLAQLNPSQRAAVEHYCGPMLVVAGAGSGKTRALTYRIANLIREHKVNPDNILAVTFTNKAAREMKDRIEKIFAEQLAQELYQRRLELLPEADQKKLRSRVYKNITKHLWIGTFHSLFSRILRYDINKYQDEKGYTWNRNFSIFDESDAQTLVKKIVVKQFNLDEKKFEPRQVRYAISNAKNLGLSPQEYLKDHPDYKGRIIAEVYEAYQAQMAANNSLDFDDLILVTVKLFQQNETVLAYWHQKFQHILVDEYQDTNRTQYDLIRLLATNGETRKSKWNWQNRSIFVVGDADQSIYSFRLADFTILLNFQSDFGDGLPDDDTRTMIKLEENYRSCENILQAANHLIENNSQRIDKVLKATRGSGEHIYYFKGDDERDEASFVIDQIRTLRQQNPELKWGSFAILYRINAQSRVFEENLVRLAIPYSIVGGLKFYDRKEIKDAVAYLRVIANPSDTVSIMRIINTPRRGIGDTTVENLVNASQELGIPLWELLTDETSVTTLGGRSAKSVIKFAKMMQSYQEQITTLPAIDILTGLMKESGYIDDLKKQGTDEADNRLENLNELYNAVIQFQEENEENTLEAFLSNASLSSDLDDVKEGQDKVSLMTLHSAKGLEFPVVFMVGLEQGFLPHTRSMDDPTSLEEERRLCYVGITRAKEQLFLSGASQRYIWNNLESRIPSQFLKELPSELLKSNVGRKTSLPPRTTNKGVGVVSVVGDWKVGDRVLHNTFGLGEVTHVLGSGNKGTLAIKFPSVGQKIIDPKVAKLQKVN